jgi:maleylpyruvate isomerase
MILYDYWRSSSAWRVRIALAWKQVPFDRRVVNLVKDGGEQHQPELAALNPLRQVPVLVVEDAPGGPKTLAQSMAILGYLEERFPAPRLLPPDPWLRARARQLAEMVNAGIQPLQNLAVTQHLRSLGVGEPLDFVRHFNLLGLAAIEKLSGETAGRFLVGEEPSWADLYLVPQLHSARRWGIDLSPYPTLVRVEASCAELPAFKAAHPDAQSDTPTAQPAP